MKIIVMLFTTVIAFFSSIFSFFLPDKPERTDFIVDGEYWGFSTAEKTMSNFLHLVEEEDTENIYAIFSQPAKENAENLQFKISELIQFLNENMTSWEYSSGMGDASYRLNDIKDREYYSYLLYTDDTTYACDIREVRMDTAQTENEGFYSISIYPEDLTKDCYGYGVENPGIYIFYPQKEVYQQDRMETLLSLSKTENSQNIYNLFAQTAKDNTENLEEKIKTLMDFFNENVTSWRFESCIAEKGMLSGEKVLKREFMFTLYTEDVPYRCNIRDMVQDSEEGESLGIYGIATYPEELYKYAQLGWNEPGIFQKELTIKPNDAFLDGGGVVTLTTSLEANLTCNRRYKKKKKKSPYTWEALLPNELGLYRFTATTKQESVTCTVAASYSEDSDVEPRPAAGILRFHGNGGKLPNESVSVATRRKTVGSTVDLTEYVPVKKGYRFTGWYADKDLKKPITEIVMEEKSAVYAGWEKIK